MIKTVPNTVAVTPGIVGVVRLLPANDRRVGVIIACIGGFPSVVAIGYTPKNDRDGIPLADGLQGGQFPPLKLTASEIGTSIQREINLWCVNITDTIVATEFLAAP